MLKGLLFIVLMIFVVGAVILLVAVNYIMSVIRRIRRNYFGYDDTDHYTSEETMRRRSHQYSGFRNTSYTANNGSQSGQQSSYNSQGESGSQQEVIYDTRDPHTANRQIISDDEGEYVDYVEEK